MRLFMVSRTMLTSVTKSPVLCKKFLRISCLKLTESLQTSNWREFCQIHDSFLLEQYLGKMNSLDATADLFSLTYGNHVKSSSAKFANLHAPEELLDQVNRHLNPDQLLEILHSLGKLLAKEASEGLDDAEKLQIILEFNHEVSSHDNYEILKEMLIEALPSYSTNAVSFAYASLRKLNEPLTSPVMTQIYIILRRNLLSLDLQSITNFLIALRGFVHNIPSGKTNKRTWSFSYINLTFYPIITKFESMVADLKTPEDVELLAFFCSNVPSMMSDSKVSIFTAKVSDLIDSGLLNPNQCRSEEELKSVLACLVRISGLKLRKKSHFLVSNDHMVKILSQFGGQVHNLDDAQILTLARVMMRSLEPANVYNEVILKIKDELASSRFDQSHRFFSDFLYIVSKLELGVIPKSKTIKKDLVDSISIRQFLTIFGGVHEGLEEILADFLYRSVPEMKKEPHFVANLASLARWQLKHQSTTFEESVTDLCLQFVSSPYVAHLTHYVTQLSYILSSKCFVPKEVVEKAIDVIPQMNPHHLAKLVVLRKKVMHTYRVKFEMALLNRFLELIGEHKFMNNTLRLKLLRIFLSLGHLFDENQLKKIEESDFYNWTRDPPKSMDTVQVIARSLNLEKRSAFETCELAAYILDEMIKNDGRAHAMIYKSVATAIFISRYSISPEKVNKFMTLTASCLLRDFDTSSCVGLVRLANVLVYYDAFTPELAVKIFNSEFLDKLDQINTKTDPFATIRINLKVLNQSVCSVYPEYNVPWFHENYCSEYYRQKLFHHSDPELYTALVDATGLVNCVRESVVSPNWNEMLFELAFDAESGKFVPLVSASNSMSCPNKSTIKERSSPKIQHIAVLKYSPKYFTLTAPHKLVAYSALNAKNLEHEGYKVLVVNSLEWDRMSLNDPLARKAYVEDKLKALLQIDSILK